MYFTRGQEERNDAQEKALASVRSERIQQLLTALDANDLRTSLALPDDIQELIGLLNEILIFGPLAKVDFNWSTDSEAYPVGQQTVFCGVLAGVKTGDENGERVHKMRMHPTRTAASIAQIEQNGMTLRHDRLGTLLHELIHCYIQLRRCNFCEAIMRYYDNSHSPGFRLIAKAIKENAWSILGVSAHLGQARQHCS